MNVKGTKRKNQVVKVNIFEKQDMIAKAEGQTEGAFAMLVSTIENAMQNLNVSLEKACQIVGSSVEEYTKAKSLQK